MTNQSNENASTYPPHDCKTWNIQHYHSQDDCKYTTCGMCNRITNFEWKNRPCPSTEEKECGHEWLGTGDSSYCKKCYKIITDIKPPKQFSGYTTETPHLKGDFSEPIVGGHVEDFPRPRSVEDNETMDEVKELAKLIEEFHYDSPMLAEIIIKAGYRKCRDAK